MTHSVNSSDFFIAFDEFISKTSSQLTINEEIAAAKCELDQELVTVTNERKAASEVINMLTQQLTLKENETVELRKTVDALMTDHKNEMTAQSQLIRARYELDIAKTQKNNMEKELQMHLADNERLQRSNQSLQREVYSLKERISTTVSKANVQNPSRNAYSNNVPDPRLKYQGLGTKSNNCRM